MLSTALKHAFSSMRQKRLSLCGRAADGDKTDPHDSLGILPHPQLGIRAELALELPSFSFFLSFFFFFFAILVFELRASC
jgi:hypothetical protein